MTGGVHGRIRTIAQTTVGRRECVVALFPRIHFPVAATIINRNVGGCGVVGATVGRGNRCHYLVVPVAAKEHFGNGLCGCCESIDGIDWYAYELP